MRKYILLVFLLIAHAHAVTGRRGFFGACLRALVNPAGTLASVVDFRSEFAVEIAEAAKKFPHLNVLRLGGATTLSPWNMSVELLAEKREPGAATVNLYGLHFNEDDRKFYYRPLIVGDRARSLDEGLHIIFDPGSGGMANLSGLANGLQRAQARLVKGGILAIAFPLSRDPLQQFATSAVQRISDAFSYDLLRIGLARRYEMVSARRSLTFFENQGSVRFDGCYVKALDGRFVALADWIEERMPDFEVVKPALVSFNQLILRRKDFSGPDVNFTLKYSGSFGRAESPNLVATPFHFFDEVSLDPNYRPPSTAGLTPTFHRWWNFIVRLGEAPKTPAVYIPPPEGLPEAAVPPSGKN